MVKKLLHTRYRVNDLAKTVSFYKDVLGLEEVKRHNPLIFTKSGIMLGLGEERLEVHQVMDDMR